MAINLERAGFISTDELFSLVQPFVEEIQDEGLVDARLAEDIASQLGFQEYNASTPKGRIMTKLGIMGSPLVGETDEYTLSSDNYGPDMGYGVVRTFPAIEITSEAKKWLKAGGKGDLTDAIRADLESVFGALRDELNAIKIAENEYMLKTILGGFGAVTSQYGPNSAVYDGMPLFSTEHKVIKTGKTYSNIVTDDAGNHAPLTYDSLRKAVEMHRNMTDGQGVRVARPSSGIYDLYVSVENEANALEVLSYENQFQPYTYAGAEAQNENFANVFVAKDGFKVRLNVIDLINQPDSTDPANARLGSADVWFVINKENAIKRKAFRKIALGDVSVRIDEDPKTRKTVASAEKHFGAQILYPEVIVGSLGDGTTVA